MQKDIRMASLKDLNGRVAMHCAAENNQMAAVEALLDKSDLDARDHGGRTAVHWSVDNGHEGVVKLLVKKQALTNMQDDFGQAAVTSSVERTGRARIPAVKQWSPAR